MSDSPDLLASTADIVAAMVSNNAVPVDELAALITSVHATLSQLGQEPPLEPETSKPEPAVTVRKSLANPQVILSMIDGKPYSSLKRHLSANGYTPQSYRAAFGLKADYPMVAPGYRERRREVALRLGLGRKRKVEEPASAGPKAKEPRKKLKVGFAKGDGDADA